VSTSPDAALKRQIDSYACPNLAHKPLRRRVLSDASGASPPIGKKYWAGHQQRVIRSNVTAVYSCVKPQSP